MSFAKQTKLLMREYATLQKKPVDGVSVLPLGEDGDLKELKVVIHGPPGTPYEGGQFLIKLMFGAEFPEAPPKGYFVTRIFHPNVSKGGDICVNTLKKDWSPTLGLGHVLTVIKCLLIYPNPASALNEEAGKLLLEAYEDFASKARLMTRVHATKQLVAVEACENADEENAPVEGADKKKAKKKAPKKKKKTLNKRL